MIKFTIAAVLLAATAAPAFAATGLNGATITAENVVIGASFRPLQPSPATFVVGDGIETTELGSFFSEAYDFSDKGLTITTTGGVVTADAPFLGMVFTSDAFLAFTEVNLISAGSSSFLIDQSDLSLSGNRFSINVAGSTRLNGNVIQIAFGPAPPQQGVIPEPATWAMLITGFGLVGAAARRRTATTHA